ncbi:MAG: hypothetical protein FWD31_02650, partial [Planctomycetaceae bacterium]|nr:hypothetical protein [Planctomycetaceae bacterium]
LTHRGIAPGKVWWSRILPYGVAYLLFCIPLVVLYMSIIAKNREFYDSFRFFLCNEPGVHWWQMNPEQWWNSFYVAVTLFAAIFCIGQMISLFVRSFLTAIPVVTAMFCGLFFWVMIVKYLLGYGGLFWAVWPMLLACLVASRLRTANWQRGRNGRRGWQTPLLTLAAPTLLILCVIPIVRVYSVPVIYLGYAVDQDFLHNRFSNYSSHNYVILHDYRIEDRGQVLKFINDSLTERRVTPETIKYAIRLHGYYNNQLEWILPQFTTSSHATPEALRELIAYMEKEMQIRPPLSKFMADTYIEEYRAIAFMPVLHPFSLFPAEKQRLLRKLNYEFQVQSQLADEIELLVYHSQGDYNMVNSKASVLAQNRRDQDREILPIHLQLLSSDWYQLPDPNFVLRQEIYLRATIIQLALQAYWLEHDKKLPETLAELEGDYLTQVPTVPITGAAFEYHPEFRHVSEEELNRATFDANKEYANLPYISVPTNTDYARNLPNAGRTFPLVFMKGEKEETNATEPEPRAEYLKESPDEANAAEPEPCME